jgi:hypothetical protein
MPSTLHRGREENVGLLTGLSRIFVVDLGEANMLRRFGVDPADGSRRQAPASTSITGHMVSLATICGTPKVCPSTSQRQYGGTSATAAGRIRYR